MHFVVLLSLILIQSNQNVLANNKEAISNFPHYASLLAPKPDDLKKTINFTQKKASENRRVFTKTLNGASCSVVGRSSNLIDSNYGKLIDSNDVVIRMNDSTVHPKFTKDIGEKTTVRVINSRKINLEQIANEEKNFILIPSSHAQMIKNLDFSQNKIIFYSQKNIAYILKDFTIKNVSNGLEGVALALSLCNQVDVFGFGQDNDGQTKNYDEEKAFDYLPMRPSFQERSINKLASVKAIHFYQSKNKVNNTIGSSIIVPHYKQINKTKNIKRDYLDNNQDTFKRFIQTVNGASCAVVGSSSNLLGSNYGGFINEHDVVFRPNTAPVNKTYEKDVGTKTTVRFINYHDNHIHITPLSENLNITAGSMSNEFIMVDKYREDLKNGFKGYYENIVLWDFEEARTLTQDIGGIRRPSSGLLMIYYAMSLCDKVDVLGFGKDNLGREGAHYYKSEIFNWAAHRPNVQDMVIKELVKQGQITFFTGNAH